MCEEKKAAPAANTLHELIDKYWDIAYAEGKEGRIHDTEVGDAHRVRSGINCAIDALIAHQPAPVAQGDAEDAARYRWLRNFHAGEEGIRDDLPHIAAGGNYVGAWALHSEEADAAIDAARAQAKKGGA